MATDIRSQPRVRAYGNSRIEITKRAQDEHEWQNLWREPLNPFPFKWGRTWKHCIEYHVEDFASEAGFFIDILGLQVSAFSPTYAQFTSPDQEFTFAVTAAAEGEPGTPPDAIRLQFQVDYLMDTILELEGRGIFFEKRPAEISGSSALAVACFRSPHGILIDLVGEVSSEEDTEEDAEFEDLDIQQDEEDEDLEGMGFDVEDELGDQTNGLEAQDELQELTEPEESVANDLDEANASGLLSWTNLVTRQEAHRSRRGQTQTYPRPSRTHQFRIPSHDAPPERPPRKQQSNGELTYSALEEEVQEYDD